MQPGKSGAETWTLAFNSHIIFLLPLHTWFTGFGIGWFSSLNPLLSPLEPKEFGQDAFKGTVFCNSVTVSNEWLRTKLHLLVRGIHMSWHGGHRKFQILSSFVVLGESYDSTAVEVRSIEMPLCP